MRIRRRETEPVGLQIAPMCDVIFLVLTFFLLTAHLAGRERSLPVRLPEAAAASAPQDGEGGRLVANLDGAGRLYLGRREIDPAAFRQALRERPAPLRVLLRADAATPARRIREIVSWSAEAGAAEVILGTAQEPDRKAER
ncbi:MAG: biopolymer transporter ExbD [Verrucomicrobium sp.]|nr:biopolymer transporter ExbD [Verrucomicrobium sp.]